MDPQGYFRIKWLAKRAPHYYNPSHWENYALMSLEPLKPSLQLWPQTQGQTRAWRLLHYSVTSQSSNIKNSEQQLLHHCSVIYVISVTVPLKWYLCKKEKGLLVPVFPLPFNSTCHPPKRKEQCIYLLYKHIIDELVLFQQCFAVLNTDSALLLSSCWGHGLFILHRNTEQRSEDRLIQRVTRVENVVGLFCAIKTSPELKMNESQPQRKNQAKIPTFFKRLAALSAFIQLERGSCGEDAISNSACEGRSTDRQITYTILTYYCYITINIIILLIILIFTETYLNDYAVICKSLYNTMCRSGQIYSTTIVEFKWNFDTRISFIIITTRFIPLVA